MHAAKSRVGEATFALAAALLALHPALWLLSSWFDGGYGSDGEWIFLGVLALFLWSWSSPLQAPSSISRRALLSLFAATALVRVASELLAIHFLGAAALAVDVYALARLLRLPERARPLAAGPLGGLFVLCLPVERLLQRSLGFPLQLLSARAACALSGALHPGLRCDGVLVHAPGAELAIDLPCSGARGLVLLLALALALGALGRARGAHLLLALGTGVGLALLVNTARVAALIEGVLRRPFGADVMQEPLHSLVGLVPLAAAALCLARGFNPEAQAPAPAAAPRESTPLPWPIGLGALLLSSLVLMVPARPLDVSGAVEPLHLPLALGRWSGEALPLSELERRYFTAFGGQAEKRLYHGPGEAPRTVIAVRTRSALRHLHPPDECLIGRGHRVERLGVALQGWAPTALYRSIDPAGRAWRVEVSWIASDGQVASSVAEIAWRSLRRPGQSWTMFERITPWSACEADGAGCAAFQEAVGRALELHPQAVKEES